MGTPFPLAMPSHGGHANLWAKSPQIGATSGETLAQHTSQVLLRLAQLKDLWPDLPQLAGNPRLWRQLYWAGFLHDWGKVAPGFQAQVRPGGSAWGRRHEVLSLAFIPYVAERNSEDWRWISAAIASHHREEQALHKHYNVIAGPAHRESIFEMAHSLTGESLCLLWEWLTERGEEWAKELGFGPVDPPVCAGPETLQMFQARAEDDICECLNDYYDWVEELGGRFPEDPPCLGPILLRGLLVMADHSGSAASGPMYIPAFERPPLPLAQEWLESFRKEWGQVHPHQSDCAAAHGSICLVAPTGSGKTESALLWAANQRDELGQPAPRLFYMLPFQASMNAMHSRLEGHLGESKVTLQHGKAKHTLYRRYMERAQNAAQAAWATRAAADLARLHVPPVRVLSPYQALKAAYRLKGYEASLLDMTGGLFICDEIHAYEVKRLALIISLLGYLSQHLNAQFCLMSTTFPRLLKQRLAEAVHPLGEINASAATQKEFERHRVSLRDGDLTDPASIQLIKERAESGLSVLVCCNTVTRAQTVFGLLEKEGLRPELLHSRFHAKDRISKESELQRRMGTRSANTDRRIIMVATQVVEVSLDIDFDTLFTDLAPLDALLQRLGRINRGRKVPVRDVIVFTSPLIPDRPYDEALLRGALSILQREFGPGGAILNESRVSGWLDEVYSDEVASKWEDGFDRARQEFQDVVLGKLHPFQASDALEELFYRAFDGVEVLPLSLKDEYLALSDSSPLEASELLVPIRWSQFCRLRHQGALVERLSLDRTPVVDRLYSSRMGLELQ